MLQLTESPLEFAYEPIVHTRTGRPFAYEQLARLPGGTNAAFLADLTEQSKILLTEAAVATALRATSLFRRPIFINVFSEHLIMACDLLSSRLEQSTKPEFVALEIHEDTPLALAMEMAASYPNLWFVLDDITDRRDSLSTFTRPDVRRNPFTVKLPYQAGKDAANGLFDPSILPATWQMIVEGVSSTDLPLLVQQGFPLAQGRDLPGQRRMKTDFNIEISR